MKSRRWSRLPRTGTALGRWQWKGGTRVHHVLGNGSRAAVGTTWTELEGHQSEGSEENTGKSHTKRASTVCSRILAHQKALVTLRGLHVTHNRKLSMGPSKTEQGYRAAHL